MTDLARALNTPVPAQPAPQTAHGVLTEAERKRDAKNERDRLRRKAKRAADLKAAQAAAKPKAKKKKRKAKKKADVYASMARSIGKAAALAAPYGKKKRGRGRPPGAKNKPKDANDILAPRGRPKAAPASTLLHALATLSAVKAELDKHTPADRAAIIAAL